MSEPVTSLAGRSAAPRPELSFRDRGPVGQVSLRADLSDPALAAAVEAAVGVPVPAVRTCAFAADRRGAVWMSPDELLLLVPYGEAGAAVATLREAMGTRAHMALDVSDARCVIALEGPDVAETLAKGAPVDLSETAFPVGSARRTHLGPVAVAFWRREPALWELVCFRSYARHVMLWLETAGAENAKVGWY